MTEPLLGQEVLSDLLDSQGDPRDLTQQQIPLLRALFEDESGMGLWLFAYYICGCKDITPHLHMEMCEFLSRWGYIKLPNGEWVNRHPQGEERPVESWRRLMMCIPRDCFKTTLGTRAAALWTITKDPEATVGIFNEAEAKCKSWIGAIKQVIEQSKLYHMLWPERLPPGVHHADNRSIPRSWKWGDTGILLVRDSMNVSELTLEPFGIGGAHVGKHFTHKIYDDIIGEKSAQSAAVMEDAIHFVDHGRAIERPSDNGCELVNYTRWAYHDVYKHMVTKWPADYRVYRRSLLENEDREPDVVSGESIFPERFPTWKCKEMWEEDPFVFASQRQNIPQAGRQTSFDKSWLRYFQECWHPTRSQEPCVRIPAPYYNSSLVVSDVQPEHAPNLIPLSWMDKAILVDPAPTKKAEQSSEPRARNGVVAVAIDPWGRKFTLQACPLREDPVTVMTAVVMLAVRWKIDKVGIEEVNFSAVYAPLWNTIIGFQHPELHLSWIPLKPEGVDKDARIRALVPPHKEGLWYYNETGTEHVIQELVEYPHSETRDLVDAQAYWHKAVLRPETPDERAFYRQRQFRETETREKFTNY